MATPRSPTYALWKMVESELSLDLTRQCTGQASECGLSHTKVVQGKLYAELKQSLE